MSTVFTSIEYAETDLESRGFSENGKSVRGYPEWKREDEWGQTEMIATVLPFQGREVEVLFTKCHPRRDVNS